MAEKNQSRGSSNPIERLTYHNQLACIWGALMIAADQPSAADVSSEVSDEVDEARLAEVMRVVPLGAGVLAGTAVALLVIGYLAIYLLVFLARGVVG